MWPERLQKEDDKNSCSYLLVYQGARAHKFQSDNGVDYQLSSYFPVFLTPMIPEVWKATAGTEYLFITMSSYTNDTYRSLNSAKTGFLYGRYTVNYR
jgi:hypothetical protein